MGFKHCPAEEGDRRKAVVMKGKGKKQKKTTTGLKGGNEKKSLGIKLNIGRDKNPCSSSFSHRQGRKGKEKRWKAYTNKRSDK